MQNETFDPGNAKFRALLSEFNKLIEGSPKPEKVASALKELKSKAARTANLTSRQVDAIAGRCDNYLNGTYGKGKENVEFKGA